MNNLKLLLLQLLVEESEDRVDFHADVERDGLQLHLPSLNLRQVQDIVDERSTNITSRENVSSCRHIGYINQSQLVPGLSQNNRD